jgi:hypothetical protein
MLNLLAISKVEHPEDELAFTLTNFSHFLFQPCHSSISIDSTHPKAIPEASPLAPVPNPLFAIGVHPTLLSHHVPCLQSEGIGDIGQTGIFFCP